MTSQWKLEGRYKWQQACCGPHGRATKMIHQHESWSHPAIMGSYCEACKNNINEQIKKEPE